VISPADRAARVRRDIEWVFGLRLFIDRGCFDRIEDLVREALTEHEIDLRREEAAER
jgi:hypothetical protein